MHEELESPRPAAAPPAAEPPTAGEWAIGIAFTLAALVIVVLTALAIARLPA